MKWRKHTMLLYAVTDRAWVGEQTLYQQAESALKAKHHAQLVEKQLGDADFFTGSHPNPRLCQQYGVPLFINDNVEVALQCHAEGKTGGAGTIWPLHRCASAWATVHDRCFARHGRKRWTLWRTARTTLA